MSPSIFFSDRKYANLISLSVCSQGYERVRRSSEEEFYLMRAHDMEEGSSHSELSTSGEHQTEEVRTAKQLDSFLLVLTILVVIFLPFFF